MKPVLLGSAVAMLCTGSVAHGMPSQSGIYTNEEETYFDDLAKRPTAPWISVLAENDGKAIKLTTIDAFQRPVADSKTVWTLAPSGHSEDRVRLLLPDGRTTELPPLPHPRRSAIGLEIDDPDAVMAGARALGLQVYDEEVLHTKDGRTGREIGIVDFDDNLMVIYKILEEAAA